MIVVCKEYNACGLHPTKCAKSPKVFFFKELYIRVELFRSPHVNMIKTIKSTKLTSLQGKNQKQLGYDLSKERLL